MSTSISYQKLWNLYQQTRLLSEQPLPEWPESAIVTACNPRGSLLTKAENLRLQQALSNRLNLLGYAYRAIVGASPDLQHQEPSYLVQCSKSEALALAREFQQNAIFYLNQQQVWLVPCLLQGVTEQPLSTLEEMLINK